MTVVAVVLGLSFLWETSAEAWQAPAAGRPEYRRLSADAKFLKANKGSFGAILANGAVPAGEDVTIFNAYLRNFFLQWTQWEAFQSAPPEESSTDPRRQLTTYLRQCTDKPIHGTLIDSCMKMLPVLAGGSEYHPVTRYNAMLALGDLNQREMLPGRRDAPTPSPKVLPILLQVISKANQVDRAKDANQDGVTVAALLGLKRHASVGIAAPAQLEQATVALLALANSPCPSGRAPEGHDWLRILAIDTLGQLGNAGNGVAMAFNKIIAAADQPTELRLAAARALGHLRFSGAANATSVVGGLARLASDCCDEQLRSFDEAKTKAAEDANLAATRGGAYGAKEAPEEVTFSRRGAMADLNNVLIALKGPGGGRVGLGGLTHAETRKNSADLIKIINDLFKALSDDELLDEELVERMSATIAQLAQLTGQPPRNTTPADDPPDDDPVGLETPTVPPAQNLPAEFDF